MKVGTRPHHEAHAVVSILIFPARPYVVVLVMVEVAVVRTSSATVYSSMVPSSLKPYLVVPLTVLSSGWVPYEVG
jgi:hypothetical protein